MTLDATVATTTANSYLTLAAAIVLAGEDIGPEAAAWEAASVADKERALMRATREIDGYLGSNWARYTWGQRRLFPRAIDFGGTISAPVPFIPQEVGWATYAQAKFLIRNHAVIDAEHTRQARGMQSASEPNTSYTREDAVVMSPEAVRVLAPFMGPTSPRGLHSVPMGSGYQPW